jgi:acyl dehydratase
MARPTKHIRHQLPVLASLGETALGALRQALDKSRTPPVPPAAPGPELRATLPPRPRDLVADYVRHVGGDPRAYRGTLPPHLFPQWGFALAAKTLRGIPYPMAKVLNGGCRLEVNAPLPADEPLNVTARLESIDDNGRRAVLHQRVVSGTASSPNAVVGHLYAIVPLGGKGEERGGANGDAAAKPRAKDAPRVPANAEEIGYWRLGADAGLQFAMLTGDFNPVHWIPAYARAFGFKRTILHGFATMARAIEGLNTGRFAGAVDRVAVFDCKFTRPLVLPARVGLYVRGAEVYVGDAPGGPAYLAGRFETTANQEPSR